MNHTAIITGSETLQVARALARSLRPHQWVKNLLVFGGLLFSQSLSDPVAVLHSVHAFLLFCFAASSIYLLNDVQDRDEDRRHPEKRLRPIASGEVGSAAAIAGSRSRETSDGADSIAPNSHEFGYEMVGQP